MLARVPGLLFCAMAFRPHLLVGPKPVDRDELWLPPGTLSRKSEGGKTYVCNTCRTRFPEHQKREWGQHVTKCALRRNEEVNDELHADIRADKFLSVSDTEQVAYLRKRASR